MKIKKSSHSKKMIKVIPLILCGGKGTRLWPLSRKSYPKQFLSLYGENKNSLLQNTHQRLLGLEGLDDPIIICNQEHRFIVAEQMREIGVKPKAIILENEGRNTAPAIALGAIKAQEFFEEDTLLLILSADHIIEEITIFQKVLKKGISYAEKDKLVTFGIIPEYPESGYGYIESESIFKKGEINGSEIKKFIEKPDKELAMKFIKSNKFTWNSGMFIFKTSLILKELKKHAPLVLDQCNKAISKNVNDLDFIRIDPSEFSKSPNIPIDIAVMEKTNLGIVIPLDAGWSDIGSWKSLWAKEEKDSSGNVIKGKVVDNDSKDCYIRSENRLLVTLGLKNLIVIETQDAILISDKKNSDHLKSVVSNLEFNGFEEGVLHKKIYRPWGNYISLIQDKRWQVKRIEVNPGSTLSLQMHNHRAEHWTVVEGTARVQINEKIFILSENQSTFIPLGAKHRLSNPGKIKLALIEVQSGDYLGEDDIIRFDDLYGRNNEIK